MLARCGCCGAPTDWTVADAISCTKGTDNDDYNAADRFERSNRLIGCCGDENCIQHILHQIALSLN